MAVESLIAGLSPEDARSSLYYAGRYIKQAEYFEEYSKDIFDDDERSVPSKLVQEVTMKIIRAIEAREGSSATNFDRVTVIRILDEITLIEANLPSDLSEDELMHGASLAADMSPPPSKKN